MSGADGARRAVAYLRLSDASEGPESPQRLAIEAWARRECVEIRAWQLDVVRGDTPIAERPGLLAAYASIRAHRAGMLVAANAERFGRDELVCWLIERAALSEGASVYTADGSRAQKRPPPPAVEAEVAYTRGAIDLARAYQRAMLRARVRAALAEKKARGERVGTVPYGYRLAADGIHLEPDDAEQDVIANVRALSADGLSQRAIVAKLAARGVVGRTGAPLRQTQVATILRAARSA